MPSTCPKVFISSTIYDFRDLRSALKYWLEVLGYEVYLSEHNDFPADSGVSSYDNCFQVIDQCDYFILLIGRRVGGWYDKSEHVSITQAEYRYAYEKMMNDDSIKIVSFVRKEIWDIQEDRKALEKYLQNNAKLESITDDQKKDIANHPSKFIEDASFIFSYLKEVGRHDEMKKSTQGILPLPKGNWIYPFYEFEDIVRSLEAVFGIKVDLGQKRALFLLRNEMFANLQGLLEVFNGETRPKYHWAEGAYPKIQGKLLDQTQMDMFDFHFLCLFAIQNYQNTISNQFIKKSIFDGVFLAYNNSTHSYDETPMHQALIRLNTYLERLMHAREKKEEIDRLCTLAEQLQKQQQSPADFVSIDNIQLVFPSMAYLTQKNVVLMLKAMLKYIDGDKNALDIYGEQLDSTLLFLPKEAIQAEPLEPTISQVEIWIQQE